MWYTQGGGQGQLGQRAIEVLWVREARAQRRIEGEQASQQPLMLATMEY
jgi:hypothetical protein